MEVKKSVMLVEDDYRLQQELLKLLTVPEDIECLGAVSSAEEAIEKIPAACPDVVLMDINLPGKSGIDCIGDLKARMPGLEIVMLTAYEEEDNIFRSLKEGASGYLLKSNSPEDVYSAIRNVDSGSAQFSGHIARKVALYFRKKKKVGEDDLALSSSAREVLELLATGYVYREIADKLDTTIEVIFSYLKYIRLKLQVGT